MINTRPTSAYQFHSSSNSAIIWKPRPTTALHPIPEQHKADLSIEISTDNDHASLPKGTLGSRLPLKLPRPLSAYQKSSPAFKINTEVLSKVYQSETATPVTSQLENKFKQISLAKKLRGLCNTRSYKLLEDCIKEKVVKRPESLVNEIREIWNSTESEQVQKRLRPQTAISKVLKTSHVYIPGFEKEKLPVIPENKNFELEKLGIAQEDMKYMKKTCEIKVVGINSGLNIPIFPGFRGKALRKSAKKPGKLQRSQTEILFKAS